MRLHAANLGCFCCFLYLFCGGMWLRLLRLCDFCTYCGRLHCCCCGALTAVLAVALLVASGIVCFVFLLVLLSGLLLPLGVLQKFLPHQ